MKPILLGGGLLLAIALTLALRLPLLRCEPFVAGAPFFLDEREYVAIADALSRGDPSIDAALPWMRAPGTSFLLLSLARLRDVPPALAACDFQMAQSGLWIAITLLVAASAFLLFGRRAAVVAALLAAILPDGIAITLLVHSDLLFCFWLLATSFAILLYVRQQRRVWLIVAGVTAGLGALTRSPMLPLMPILLLWIAAAAWRDRSIRPSWAALRRIALPVALFVGCFVIVIAPWTIRNYRVHGGLVVSDTLGAINLWNDNAPIRHTTFAALMTAADGPVERQRYATRQAMRVITDDPLRFARKFAANSARAWSPPAFQATWNFWQGLIERPRAGAILTQLDTLLALLIPLALLGLVVAPRHAAGAPGYRWAIAALLLAYTGMMGLTHVEPRFRTPFALLLLPYAAWSLTHPRSLGRGLRRWPSWVVIGASLAIVIGFWGDVWPAQWINARALALHSRGLIREAWGDRDGALRDQQTAGSLQPELREARVAAANRLIERGDVDQAEQEMRSVFALAATRSDRVPPDAVVALQRILIATGRVEEATALDRELALPNRRRAETIAWGDGVEAGSQIDVGISDLGLVRGFYAPQQSDDGAFRWSQPRARALLRGAGDHVCATINAARPGDEPPPVVALSADGTPIGEARPPRNGWATFCAPLPDLPRTAASYVEIGFSTTPYNPFTRGDGNDPRDLGIAARKIALRSGPLAIDPESGLLLDHAATSSGPNAIALLGLTGDLAARPGATIPLTLWWRGAQPPAGSFTFVHLLDQTGAVVASYNAPVFGGQPPAPWLSNEVVPDHAAIAIPATIGPGSYRLVGGLFDPQSGTELARSELGLLQIRP